MTRVVVDRLLTYFLLVQELSVFARSVATAKKYFIGFSSAKRFLLGMVMFFNIANLDTKSVVAILGQVCFIVFDHFRFVTSL